jgi:predicted nucleic acid-binding protein
MIDKIFFDTNIIVYLFDSSQPLKQKKVKTLLKDISTTFRLFVSTQVIRIYNPFREL